MVMKDMLKKTPFYVFLVILASIAFSATAGARELVDCTIGTVGEVREPLEYRIVSFHRGRANKEVIKQASRLGYNGVMIQLEGDNMTRLEEFAALDKKEHYIELCHELGMDITLWVHELSSIPDDIGEISPDNDKLWELIDKRYDYVLGELLPDIDGLVLTVVETQYNATDPGLLGKLTEIIDQKTRKYDKDFIMRTFTWRPDELAEMMVTVEKLPSDVIIMSKCVPQDWQMRGTHNPTIGNVDGRKQIVEYDVAGEYFFTDHVANAMPALVKHYFDYGLTKGVDGVCARVDRGTAEVWLAPQEVNMWALGMLASGMTDSLEDIWHKWATERYGSDLADDIIEILKPTQKVVTEIVNIGPFSHGDTRYRPSFVNERIFSNTHQPQHWDKSYMPAFEKASVGDPDFTRKVRVQKRKAAQLARKSLEQLEAIQDKMNPVEYDILHTKLWTNQVLLEMRTPVHLAILKFKRLVNIKDKEEQAQLASEIRELLKTTKGVIDRPFPELRHIRYKGKWFRVGSPTRLQKEEYDLWIRKMERELAKAGQPAPGYVLEEVPEWSRETDGK